MSAYNAIVRAMQQTMNAKGEEFSLVRGNDRSTVRGAKAEKGNYIVLFPDTDIKKGDILVSAISGRQFYIIDIDIDAIESKAVQLKAFYETDTERLNAEKAKAITYSIGTIQG